MSWSLPAWASCEDPNAELAAQVDLVFSLAFAMIRKSLTWSGNVFIHFQVLQFQTLTASNELCFT